MHKLKLKKEHLPELIEFLKKLSQNEQNFNNFLDFNDFKAICDQVFKKTIQATTRKSKDVTLNLTAHQVNFLLKTTRNDFYWFAVFQKIFNEFNFDVVDFLRIKALRQIDQKLKLNLQSFFE